MLPNIVLVGFMGCGKSSIGRRLAGLTGHRFVDTDEMVVAAEGSSIPEIFAVKGEEGFRVAESVALSELVGVLGVVLSTGGGIVISEANRANLRQIGVVAWLDASPDVLFERAMRSGRRPLLQTENPRERFDSLLAARRDLYEAASDFCVETTGLGHDAVAAQVLEFSMRTYRRQA